MSEKKRKVRFINPYTGFDSNDPLTYINTKSNPDDIQRARDTIRSTYVNTHAGAMQRLQQLWEKREQDEIERQAREAAAEALLNNYGAKRIGDKVVYASPYSPLPDPDSRGISKAQSPGAYGIAPGDYVRAMKAFDRQAESNQVMRPFSQTEDQGARDFVARWFPEKPNEVPTQDEVMQKYASLAENPVQQEQFWNEWSQQSVLNDSVQAADHDLMDAADAMAYEDAVRLLGKDAQKYAGMSEQDYYARYKNDYGYRQTPESPINISLDNAVLGGTFANPNYDLLRKTQLSDEEENLYNYIRQKYGDKEAENYLASLSSELNKRLTNAMVTRSVQFARENPVIAGIGSLLDSVAPTSQYGAMALDKLLGNEIDQYDPRLIASRTASAAKGEIAGQVRERFGPIGEILYSAGTSAIESLSNAALYGPSAVFNMGAKSAESTFVDVKERGGTDEQALLMGGASGIFEGLFERFSLDNIVKMASGGGLGGALKNIIRSMGIEASEEGATSVANLLAEQITLGDLSTYEQTMQGYVNQGMNEDDARAAAVKDMLINNVGMDMLVGGIAGGISGGASYFGGMNSPRQTRVAETQDRQAQNWAYGQERGYDASPLEKLAQETVRQSEQKADEVVQKETGTNVPEQPAKPAAERRIQSVEEAPVETPAQQLAREREALTNNQLKRVIKSIPKEDRAIFEQAYRQNNAHMDVSDYYIGYVQIYEAAKNGKYESLEDYRAALSPRISPASQEIAWNAGKRDMPVMPSNEPKETVTADVTESRETEVQPQKKETSEEKEASSSGKLANELLTRFIQKGNTFGSAVLFKEADKAFGGTQAEGRYTPKDAYDAMELAVNKHLLTMAKDMNGSVKDAKRALNRLENLISKLPTQTKRTEEQQQYQQFSTPPNIAYLAAWLGNIQKTDEVLEPSAGIGGIAAFAKAWGAKVDVNELSERRLAVLKEMGFDRVFNENAEQINNVLPEDVKPMVVLMNPPFSATAGRMSKNSTQNATRHIEQALLRLQAGGRLVAVLGKGMADDAPAFQSWFKKIRQKYNIRANIQIDGTNYRKYGTTWDVQLMVIDKTGPQTGKTVTGVYKDLRDVPAALEEIRNDRGNVAASAGVEQKAAVKGGAQASEGLRNERGAVPAGRGAEGNAPVVRKEMAGRNSVKRADDGGSVRNDGRAEQRNSVPSGFVSESGVQPDVRDRTAVSKRGQQRGSNAGIAEATQDEGQAKAPAATWDDTDKLERAVRPERAVTPKKTENTNSIYSEYEPVPLPVVGAMKHPTPLVESAAMAAVQPPKATYVPNLPKSIVESGAISSAQLENVIYAGQAMEKKLPDGRRRGYFIGDGTGVGKGRQISAIILDNFRRGRTKAVWVSNDKKLLPDAQNDWKDIGGDPNQVVSIEKFKAGTPIDMESGILYTTYDTMKSGLNEKSRLNQLIDWLGEDFDGVIAFDEAHNMANALGKRTSRGKSGPSMKATASIDLQKKLKNARVLYASATGASDVSELAFAQRLGLWGEGTAFRDENDFVDKISSAGLSAMELVARDMKASGSYLARSVSYDGVTYETLQHDLDPMQKEIYDTMSEAWQVTLQNINAALDVTGATHNPNARAVAKSAYYGAMQRFYNQVLTSLSMPSVIEDIRKQLSDGKSVVLQIVNTNEAETDRQLAKIKSEGGDLESLDLTPRGALLGYLEKSFPVQAFEEYEDEKGVKRSRPVTDSNGKAVLDREAVAMRDGLIERVQQMSIPDGVMEMLFNAFGTENVAEVTGRTRRVVPRKNEKGERVMVEEPRSNRNALADADAFQAGEKRILVFSDAGGTGKSYHADRRAKNQQKRVHYLVQPGWSASKATQGFGRTHRSNQVTPPEFKLVTTDVMGQKRFVSTIARRLDQLGALTKGQRETGSSLFSAKDNLESNLARDSLHTFYSDLISGRIEGIKASELLQKLGLEEKFTDQNGRLKMNDDVGRDMNTFLNRILALKVDEQNAVFSAFYDRFEEAYDRAVETGTLDIGMQTVKADKIEIVDDTEVRKDEESGAVTRYVQAKTYTKPTVIRNIVDLEGYRQNYMGLYRTDEGDAVAVYRLSDQTDISTGRISKRYMLQSPSQTKRRTWKESTFKERAQAIPRREWTKAWEEEIKKQPEYIEETVHMLTGTLLPVWNLLPQQGNTKAMRIIADDGRQYLGRVIAARDIDEVLARLGAGARTKETYTPEMIMDAVLKKNQVVRLMNDRMAIKRSRVSGENRIELTGSNVWYIARNIPDIIAERIVYVPRYFIPVGEKGKSIIERIVRDNPVSEVVNQTGEVDYRTVLAESPAGARAADWTAKRVGSEERGRIGLSDIVEKMRKRFDVPIISGHVRGRGISGMYNNRTIGVRSRIINDLPTISHEIGHHIMNVNRLSEKLTNDIRTELWTNMTFAQREMYARDREKGVREGFAEFIRKYLQNSDTAKINFPKTYAMLRDSIDMTALDELADDVNAYYSLSARDAQDDIRLREDKATDQRTLKDKISGFADRMYLQWYDTTTAIKKFDDATGAEAHVYAINSAYADAVSAQIITGELSDMNGQPLGESLQKALEGIDLSTKNKSKEYRLFNEYLVVKHGPERLREGMRIFASDLKNSEQWMNSRRKELEDEHPAFKEASERLYAFQKAFLQAWGVESGVVSEASAKRWAERWKYYVPLNRVTDRYAGVKRGFANQQSPIKRARGSSRDLYAPIDNIIANITRMVNVAKRTAAMREIARAAEEMPDTARWLERIPDKMVPKMFDTTGIKSDILRQIGKSSLDEQSAEEIETILEKIDDVIMQFERGRPNGDVITVLEAGRPVFYKVNDPLLLESLTNMAQGGNGAIVDAIGRVGRFVTGNITGRNIVWSLMSNAPRDFVTLLVYSKNKNVFSLMNGIAESYVNTIKDAAGKETDPLYKEFLAMGGGRVSAYTADRNLQLKMRKLLSGDKKRWLNPMEWLEVASDVVEKGPRFAIYKDARMRGENPQEAFYTAMESTVNFRRGGSLARQVNKVIPFFNASLQGVDRMARFFAADDIRDKSARPKARAARAAAFVTVGFIVGILQHLLSRKDEETEEAYENLSSYTKLNYWVIPMGDQKFFAIPKPRELAVLSSAVQVTLDQVDNENPYAFEGFGEYIASNLLPPGIGEIVQGEFLTAAGSLPVLGPLVELGANKDYLGRPIESTAMERLLPKDRYTQSTSALAKGLGELFNQSPVQIDYLGNNILGGFWQWQRSLFPVGEEKRDLTLGVKSKYVKDSLYSQDHVNRMYDSAEALQKESNSNPDDFSLKARHKWLSDMSSFYGKYYALAKNDPETETARKTRYTVLEMIDGMNRYIDGYAKNSLMDRINGIAAQSYDTSVLPGVMQTYVKDDDKQKHELSADQYVEYQTYYLGRYWDYVNAIGPTKINSEYLKEAKAQAQADAESYMLKKIGVSGSQNDPYIMAGISDKARAEWITKKTDAESDGELKREEVISILDGMDVSDSQKGFLYETYSDSELSNPYASVDDLNEAINEKGGSSSTKASITKSYKALVIARYMANDREGLEEAIRKLQQLDVFDADGNRYYTKDMVYGWIEDYLKDF